MTAKPEPSPYRRSAWSTEAFAAELLLAAFDLWCSWPTASPSKCIQVARVAMGSSPRSVVFRQAIEALAAVNGMGCDPEWQFAEAAALLMSGEP